MLGSPQARRAALVRRGAGWRWEALLPYLLLCPAFVVMFSLIAFPLVFNVYASLLGPGSAGTPGEPVGLRNYLRVLTNPIFPGMLANTVIWTAGVTALQVCLGMVFALLLNRRTPGRAVFRALAILPWITPGVVAAVSWRWLYHSEFGLLNNTLKDAGLAALTRPWLTDPTTAMLAVILVGVWKGFGFYFIMLLAGLQGIPAELYEAAAIDGASAWRRFWAITVPQLGSVLGIAGLLGIIWTSNYFDAIYILTGGGPARRTETFPIFIYNTAFEFYRLPEASAASVILMTLVVLFVALYLAILARRAAAGEREEGVI